MEFDDPSERTASRLFAVIVQVGNAALKVHHLQMDLFDKVPFYKVVDEDRERFRKEFNAYLKRIKHYKQALMGLPDDSVDTDEVYLGLIKRRQGAGPERLRGTVQNDILKEYAARGNYRFPVEPSLRLTTDVPQSFLDGKPFVLTERRHLALSYGPPVEES